MNFTIPCKFLTKVERQSSETSCVSVIPHRLIMPNMIQAHTRHESWFTPSTVNRSCWFFCILEGQTCRNSCRLQLTSDVVLQGQFDTRVPAIRVVPVTGPIHLHCATFRSACREVGRRCAQGKRTEQNSYSSSRGSILVCVKQQERDVSGMRGKYLNRGNNQLHVGSQRKIYATRPMGTFLLIT